MEGFKIIYLTDGSAVKVDSGDFNFLSEFKWSRCSYANCFYAVTRKVVDGRKTAFLMHRLIMKASHGIIVDHVNHDGMDNRKSNLRFATHTKNLQNSRKMCESSSIYKGVYWCNRANKWITQIKVNKRKIMHTFERELDAALKYDSMAREYFNEFAAVNFN